MKRLLLAALVALLPAVARAQSVPAPQGAPLVAGFVWRFDQWAAAFASKMDWLSPVIPHLQLNIAALRADTLSLPQYIVLGWRAAGDDNGGLFVASSTDTTSADNGGTIIVNAAGVRYYRQLHGRPVTPMMFGCYGDFSTDDTACFQAALTASANKKVETGNHVYSLSSTVSLSNSWLQGCGANGRYTAKNCGLYGSAPGMTVLSIGSDAKVSDLFIGSNGTSPATGAAIVTGASSLDVLVDNVFIDGFCAGASLSGNTVKLQNSTIADFFGSTCYGVIVGAATTGGSSTDIYLSGNRIIANQASPGGASVLIKDTGGVHINDIDHLYAINGVKIYPGLNQKAVWTYLYDVMGDTTVSSPLAIDTADPTASITSVNLIGGWMANHKNGPAITISTSAGGASYVHGFYMNGARINNGQATAGDDIDVAGNVSDLQLSNNQLCGGFGVGISVASGITNIGIRGNQIGPTCADQGGTLTAAVAINNNTGFVLKDNNLCGAAVATTGTPAGFSIVRDNECLDQASATAASASTLTLPSMASTWGISGTTTVSNIVPVWNNRELTAITISGAVQFATGGSGTGTLCNTVTSSGGNASILLKYDIQYGCWLAK